MRSQSRETKTESYFVPIPKHIHITVGAQRISNPSFNRSVDDITVYGLRTQIDL